MTPSQLHELDMTIAKAMGKPHPRLEFDGCWIKKRENEFVRFQPTYDPADAMEVLGWIMDRSDVAAIMLDGTRGMYSMCEYWNEDFKKNVFAKTLPLAICLFAEKIIPTSPSK